MGSSIETLSMRSALLNVEREAYGDLLYSNQESSIIPSIKQTTSQAQRVLPLTSALSEIEATQEIQPTKNPHFVRTPSFPIEKLLGSLPEAQVDANVDHATIVSSFLKELDQFRPELFTEDAVWRDLYALTGTVRTFNGPERIHSTWTELFETHHPSSFALIPGTSKVVRLGAKYSWVQARFSFESAGQLETLCSGQIGLVPDSSSGWKIWLMTTILEEIKGFPNPDFIRPDAENAIATGANEKHESSRFECVVVGAGFAGLCLAGRLKATGISYAALERNSHVGDNWTNRYESARFHTSRDYSDMPLERIFTQEDSYFLSGKDLARGYQRYVEKHDLNIWLSSTLKSASYSTKNKLWTLTVDRAGEKITIMASHLVLAIGGGGSIPVMPHIPNREVFKGTVIHSVDYKNCDQWAGKKGAVIGTANTAHDVAEDMLDAGLISVTMVQRSRTAVFPIEWYKLWSDPIYNINVPIEEADRQIMAIPLAITRQASILSHNTHVDKSPAHFDALERAGFKVERYGDLWKCLSHRLGGHYMDVGASAKISAGLIKVKGDAALASFTPTGLEFSDGSTLDADVVVFCTGFEHDVRKEATKIVGPEIASRLDDYWDIDDEGELRGVYKPMDHPGIWYQGGGVTYARFYSRFIALQIKADIAGVPLQLYRKKPA